jgi:hypothetical protein
MGILRTLLTFPVSAPAGGALWVARQIHAAAEREISDPAAIRRALRALEEDLEAGRITEDAFEEAEEILLGRLAEAGR